MDQQITKNEKSIKTKKNHSENEFPLRRLVFCNLFV